MKSHYAVNACLAPVAALHGQAVTTVEGIGNVRDKLHPVQERIAKAHGSQCGFCTPGIVMSMYALLRSLSRKPTMKDMEIAFQGIFLGDFYSDRRRRFFKSEYFVIFFKN